MVKFSIIIVNYNVKYFLEQCLYSVKKAIHQSSSPMPSQVHRGEWKAEVFVVDNNSPDNSIQYLKTRFPSVKFLSNHENTGFAKANNQALQMATGQYILFLNPDTILPEDFFVKCLEHMETNQRTGALGVQMIDGSGKFLKESKRGFPETWAAFCKLSGLTTLFPTSKAFAKYYMGHLDAYRSHEVEVLSGACMLIRKEVLDRVGGFDERFFMYAEDIDLSYRIRHAAYTNHYLADICIIHFKGESTTRDMRYVKLFYKAMIQFVQKHYHGTKGTLYVRFMRIAIGIRRLVAVGGLQLDRKTGKPVEQKQSLFLKGDECSSNQIRETLQHADHIRIVPTPGGDSETVLCEGDQLSFKEIIKTMRSSPGQNYKVHALNSFGIVGSSTSFSQGEVIILVPKSK